MNVYFIMNPRRDTPCPYDMIMNYRFAELLKMRYDVNHTTEVYLRDTTVTFLNKLMKRVKKY